MSHPPQGLIRSIRLIRHIRIPLSVDHSQARWTRRPEKPSQQLPDPDSRIEGYGLFPCPCFSNMGRNSPYPSSTSFDTGMNLSDAEFMQ